MTTGLDTAAGDDVARLAVGLADQSLGHGAVGSGLLHVERAMNGAGDWAAATTYLRQVTAGPIDVAAHAGLYYGAPAVAFVLHAARADGRPRYSTAAQHLIEHVVRLTRRRLTAASCRAERAEATAFAEYDLFYGLTGLGALLLVRRQDSDVLADVLRYVVALTRPCRRDGLGLPGWWVEHDPDQIVPTPGGHANFGMAHGAAGLLALLSLATTAGHRVDGQAEAIDRLVHWFDRWRQDSPDGPWWPHWITRDELIAGGPVQRQPGRPSWCYGTVGITRAQQLAAIATGDHARRAAAEDAMAACLTDHQLDRITDAGLCHGIAGVYQTAFRAARQATGTAISRRLPAVASRLALHAAAAEGGLLTGAAGARLALETLRRQEPPCSGWDACLLIT